VLLRSAIAGLLITDLLHPARADAAPASPALAPERRADGSGSP
jgi:hypothetical protein